MNCFQLSSVHRYYLCDPLKSDDTHTWTVRLSFVAKKLKSVNFFSKHHDNMLGYGVGKKVKMGGGGGEGKKKGEEGVTMSIDLGTFPCAIISPFFLITIIYSYKKNFWKKLFKLFLSLECMYNKLQFGLRISPNETSKQNLCIFSTLYDYNKTYSKEIHPGATPFSRTKGIKVFSSSIGISLP